MNCQAIGCRENAPHGIALDLEGVEVVVYLCRRHERDLGGAGVPARTPPPRPRAPERDDFPPGWPAREGVLP